MKIIKTMPLVTMPCPDCKGSGYAPVAVRESPDHYICGPCFGRGRVAIDNPNNDGAGDES